MSVDSVYYNWLGQSESMYYYYHVCISVASNQDVCPIPNSIRNLVYITLILINVNYIYIARITTTMINSIVDESGNIL